MSPVARDRGVFVGMMGLEDDARVDFARLRAERRAKVLSGMESHDLDALMLGGVGNVRYVSGARQLGRSGVLPFAPVAVVVRDTGRVHLLSTWDEGVPPEIGRDDLYRMSWNPANLAADLAKIPGLRDARRVGTDGLTPMFAALIPELVTKADLVDAGLVMTSTRQAPRLRVLQRRPSACGPGRIRIRRTASRVRAPPIRHLRWAFRMPSGGT